MFRKLFCGAALLALGLTGAHAGPVVSVTPTPASVTVGSTFTMDIRISGVSDLFGWSLDLGWSLPSRLGAQSVAEGTFLGAPGSFGAGSINNATGSITTIFDASSGSTGASGSGLLAKVTFTALSLGTATVSFSNVQLIDSNLDPIFFDIVNDARFATVNIVPVPEPSTAAMFAVALACAGLARLRRA